MSQKKSSVIGVYNFAFARQDWLMVCRNHRTRYMVRATRGKGGAATVVLSHSARLNAKKSARVTDETHPAKLGRPASNYNVSRHYDAGKRDRFSCDFRRDRTCNELGAILWSDQKAGNLHRSFIGELLIFSIIISSALNNCPELQCRKL